VPGPHFDPGLAGSVLRSTGDVVSSAPELLRLALNIAAAHHDSRIGGRRLVYGAHTFGLALGQASRLLPNLVTVLGWESCDHTGPVHEGDSLYSELHIESPEPTDHGGVLGLRSLVYAVSDTAGEPDRPVLDWRFSALQFYSQEPKRRTQIVSLCRINNRPQQPRSVDISLSSGCTDVAAHVLFCTARNRRP
jgi:acyl dehydratase